MVAGVPLALTFHVARVDGPACAPLAGAYLDVWHADPAGAYSDVAGFGTPGGGGPGPRGRARQPGAGPKFLRGYQVTDATAAAHFQTVYPGWYAGRAVHVHFKLRLYAGAAKTYEFTSQFFFDDALTDRVHAGAAPYSARGPREVRNVDDGVFNELGAAERGALTLRAAPAPGAGYAGVIDLAVRVG
ncbi:hypothetical protein tb265_40190 [Gemmatimonadetes bacterium T265]|nr:hypothetical protein tb265_40190 [Gemmatimonadetes bacterium T265]